MGELERVAATPSSGGRQRRPAEQRLKLNRELMLRLAAAIRHRSTDTCLSPSPSSPPLPSPPTATTPTNCRVDSRRPNSEPATCSSGVKRRSCSGWCSGSQTRPTINSNSDVDDDDEGKINQMVGEPTDDQFNCQFSGSADGTQARRAHEWTPGEHQLSGQRQQQQQQQQRRRRRRRQQLNPSETKQTTTPIHLNGPVGWICCSTEARTCRRFCYLTTTTTDNKRQLTGGSSCGLTSAACHRRRRRRCRWWRRRRGRRRWLCSAAEDGKFNSAAYLSATTTTTSTTTTTTTKTTSTLNASRNNKSVSGRVDDRQHRRPQQQQHQPPQQQSDDLSNCKEQPSTGLAAATAASLQSARGPARWRIIARPLIGQPAQVTRRIRRRRSSRALGGRAWPRETWRLRASTRAGLRLRRRRRRRRPSDGGQSSTSIQCVERNERPERNYSNEHKEEDEEGDTTTKSIKRTNSCGLQTTRQVKGEDEQQTDDLISEQTRARRTPDKRHEETTRPREDSDDQQHQQDELSLIEVATNNSNQSTVINLSGQEEEEEDEEAEDEEEDGRLEGGHRRPPHSCDTTWRRPAVKALAFRLPGRLLWALLVLGLLLLTGGPQWRSSPGGHHHHLTSALQVTAGPGGSTSEEQLSRAILATMSTQSSVALAEPPHASLGPQQAGQGAPTSGLYPDSLDEPQPANYPPTPASTAVIAANATASHASANQTDGHLLQTSVHQEQPPPPPVVWDNLLNFGRIFVMCAIIVGDICGNSLVILSVCRHTKLRVTTNWFVVSLACADILVALFAMTFNASVVISGRWLFPRWMCDFWNSCDVLASTASILHLCCISIDRYIAITRPLEYPSKITTRRVVYALCAVWISSALLSYIPIFTGVYTTSEHIQWLRDHPDQCEFVVNRVYAIVSSSISFWIPCCIMVFTYYRIYREASRQEKFIYKAQSMVPAPMVPSSNQQHSSGGRSKQQRSKSMAVGSSAGTKESRIMSLARQQQQQLKNDLLPVPSSGPIATTNLNSGPAGGGGGANKSSSSSMAAEVEPLTGSAIDLNNNNNSNSLKPASTKLNSNNNTKQELQQQQQQQQQQDDDQDERDSNSGQSTPTKRSISKMKREHKAAKTLGIIMGVFILCWLPFFSWYTPQNICGHNCSGIIPPNVVALLFWIGYFNSTLNPIIYAYFNHEFRDAFKKTLQWLFCCCQDLKCLRVSRPNDNQHYNCTYRSTQEIGLVTNS